MEVTYLRLDPVQPETDIFNEYMSQQIVYSSINQYGADVIIPKTLPMKLNGSTLCRNQFWYDNVPDLIVTTVQPSWSNGQPRVSVKFDSDNLLQILQFCDTTPPTKVKQATVEKIAISDFHEKVYIGTVGDNFYKEWFKIVQED